jgi:pimeloyl-ACP methyl ester carboxylesterase
MMWTMGALEEEVIIIPGFMGSNLVDTARGRTLWSTFVLPFTDLRSLRLEEDRTEAGAREGRIEPRGDLWPVYRGLMRSLRKAGFRVRFFAFDWRRPVEHGADAFKEFMEKEIHAATTHLVAHSMGCLVASLWLAGGGASKIGRMVCLNFPVRGVEMTVSALLLGYSRLAAINLRAGRRLVHRLAWEVPSLYEMLPPLPGIFDPAAWPEGLGIRPRLLESAYSFRQRLETALETLRLMKGRIALVSGVGERMARWVKGENKPISKSDRSMGMGDGWILQDSSLIEDVPAYSFRRGLKDSLSLGPLFLLPYIGGSHPFTPMFPRIQKAIIEFLGSRPVSTLGRLTPRLAQ